MYKFQKTIINRFERFMFNYGAVVCILFLMCMLTYTLYNFQFGVTGMLAMLASNLTIATYSYINGWFRGRWEERDRTNEILRAINANSISGKTKQKTH